MKGGDMPWVQSDAVALCRQIEAVCPDFGCHVALTGGLLYKDGKRKDADILFYRIRQVDQIDVDGLMIALAEIGVQPGEDFGWCFKASWQGKPIDFFFPERDGDYYPQDGIVEALPIENDDDYDDRPEWELRTGFREEDFA